MHSHLAAPLVIALLAGLAACTAPKEEEPQDYGKVWGGGQVTVTFTTDSGTGLAGSFTTPGSDRASINESFLSSTALWWYPWDVEGQEREHRYELSVNVSDDTDFSDLDVSLRCPAVLSNLVIRLDSQDRTRIDFGTFNEYLAERPTEFVGIVAELTETGSMTADLEWWALNEYCPAEDGPLEIGTGTITVDWAFDTEFVPDDHPISSVSDIPF